MADLGINLVPILKSKLEALSAGVTYVLLLGLMPIGIGITSYVLFYSDYWYIAAIYLIWIWVIDSHTPYESGRMNTWVRSWSIFKYTANYFPINVHTEPGVELDPKRNYLACCFPHGIMPTGLLMTFQTNATNIKERIPYHTTYGAALRGIFYIPIYRDFLLSIGLCNANAKTIENRLSRSGGGQVLGIMIGGSAEMFYCQSGHYRVILKNRKGFIKIALRTGSPLLPIFSFGENSIYKQKIFAEGSLGRRFQDLTKRIIGFPIILFYGRGLFLDGFGMIPFKTPINIVAGKPINVEKVENPTQAEIDALHKIFVNKLTELFEEYKYHYEPNPEKCKLIVC